MATPAPTALLILFSGCEEVEAITPVDLLRRAGVKVTVASLGPERRITGRSDLVLEAETDLRGALDRTYDAVVLPGGPGVRHLRDSAAVLALVEEQSAAGRCVAAICAATTVLHDAGILQGRSYTGHFSVAGELPEIIADQAVVRDDNIITSRGAGTAVPFALEIIAALASPAAAKKVAEAICYPQ